MVVCDNPSKNKYHCVHGDLLLCICSNHLPLLPNDDSKFQRAQRKGFLPFDDGCARCCCCCLLCCAVYAGPTGSLDSISCSLLCFGLYWTRKMDSWWISGGFSACDGTPTPLHLFNYITLIDTLLYINWVKLGNQAALLSQTIALLSWTHHTIDFRV